MAAVGSVARLSSSSVWTLPDDENLIEILVRIWRPVISFETKQKVTCLYEDLLIGEQVDVQTTVHEGLLRGEQADVYSHRSSMSCCGTNSLNVPALQQLPACSSGCFCHEYQALQQVFKEAERNKEHEEGEGGKGGKEEDNREISRPRIDESSFLPCAYS